MARSLRGLLVLICCALAAGLLQACGSDDAASGDAAAEQILRETFAASSEEISNARLRASLRLDPEGLLALGGPIALSVNGPFASAEGSELPRFSFLVAATLAGRRFHGRALSTGTKGYVKVDGRAYRIDDAFMASLRKELGGDKATPKAGLNALGIDPVAWVEDPVVKGNERVAGVDTIRIAGELDVERMLADLAAVLTKAGAAGLLTPALRERLAAAVESSSVDVWTGAADKLMRQIAVSLKFDFKDGKSPIIGLDGGTIGVRIQLDDVNETSFSVVAPKRARSIRQLTGGGLHDFLAGIGGSLGAGGAGSLGPAALLACINRAGASTSALMRCASKLER